MPVITKYYDLGSVFDKIARFYEVFYENINRLLRRTIVIVFKLMEDNCSRRVLITRPLVYN
jgi:hypothetical protein